VLAQRNFLNCLEINAKQEFRELSAHLLLPQWRQGARLGAQGESDKHATPRRCLMEMNMVDGRGGTRARGTLLAKREPPGLTVAG
jgi:hypothetical protein